MIDFRNTKGWFTDNVTRLVKIGNDINGMHNMIDPSNRTLKHIFTESLNIYFDKHLARLKTILGIIERDRMKCVLFGKTSNGKSAVINALLGEKILPSDMGRTTACFISVKGCEKDEGYIKIDNNKEKLNPRLLNKMANQLSENKCDINSMLKVYWPKSKCRLLENDLEILDSPGADYTKEHDEWITRYCEDADVFILVVDGRGTLNESDKLFFKRITEKISKPNILVIVNKWDMVEQDVNVELIKKQYFDIISRFLCDELKLCTANMVSNRIHFVSAIRQLNGKGNKSFSEFEEYLETEVSQNAEIIKFKPHLNNIRLLAFEINEVANKFLEHRNTLAKNTEEIQIEISKFITLNFANILEQTEMIINGNITYLENQIKKAVSERRDFDVDTINFLENDFIQQLSFIFTRNLQNLENQIIEEYAKRCYADVNPNQMEMYFTGQNNLSDISKKYEECLSENIRHTTSEIRNVNKQSEERITKLSGVVKKVRKVSNSLFNPAVLISGVSFPAGVVLGVASILGGMVPDLSTSGIEKSILSEFTSFYSNMTKYFIEQFQIEVTQKINQSITEYLEHQNQLFQSFECFQDIKSKIVIQICIMMDEDKIS